MILREGTARFARTFGWIGAGAGLAFLILSHSFAAYYAETAPDLALSLNADQPTALVRLARSRLTALELESRAGSETNNSDEGSSRLSGFSSNASLVGSAVEGAEPKRGQAAMRAADDHSEIRSLAERALTADPLNATALYLLGRVAELEGKTARATDFMSAAVHRSRRETGAALHMLRRGWEARDNAQVLELTDAILRTAPGMRRHLVPLLARMAEDDKARLLLTERIIQNPPWRAEFLSDLPRAVTDARTPLNILLELRDTPAPPKAADLRGYLDFLIQNGFYELAYYAWLQFLPPEDLSNTGLLFNGNFARDSSGLPFDWNISRGAGATIQMLAASGVESGRALQIEFGHGRIEFGRISQMILLAPGTYRFAGRVRGEVAGRRGLVWRIACASHEKLDLAEIQLPLGRAPAWRRFETEFTVPAAECSIQRVRLTHDARSASEQFISGVLWIAELSITRK